VAAAALNVFSPPSNQMFLCTLPGYIDASAMRGTPSLTLSDLDQRFRLFLRDYHARPHGETRQPPQERWGQGGFLPRIPDSLEQLDLLLLTVAKTRTVQPDAVFRACATLILHSRPMSERPYCCAMTRATWRKFACSIVANFSAAPSAPNSRAKLLRCAISAERAISDDMSSNRRCAPAGQRSNHCSTCGAVDRRIRPKT
jgi:hypothetical protein